ncbi:hypothetical protein GJ633_15800, partial [Halorubrum sp. CBA1125]|nr:hypothetical protein [Halorubrum sp. CBA1125]
MTRRGLAPSRRRLLAATATGLAAAIAGCGYVPSGGDLAWEASVRTGGLAFGDETWLLSTADRLVSVRNQSGRTFDVEADAWRDVSNAAVAVLGPDGTVRDAGETERQVVGSPTVGDGAAFLPVEDGRMTAVDLSADDDGSPDSGGETVSEESDDGPSRWRVDALSGLAASPDGDAVDGDGSEDALDGDGNDDALDGNGNDDGDADHAAVLGVRASDALAVAVTARGLAAFDAETGDHAFAREDVWTDGEGEAVSDPRSRVAVDGEDVW